MRLLIAHGADVKSDVPALLAEVHSQGGAEVEQVLREAGIETREAAQLNAILATGQSMVNVGFTERLLARGATLPQNDARSRAFGARLLGYAAAAHELPVARTILGLGGDPNQKGARGVTPLMMAAGAAEPDAALVQLLIDKGADVGARDDRGRTALDWALLQGDTAAAQVLRKSGAAESPAPPHPVLPAGSMRTPRAAVEAALSRTAAGRPPVLGRRQVHLVSPSDLAVDGRGVGERAGRHRRHPNWRVHPSQATISLWGPLRDDLLLGRVYRISIGGFVGTAGYALLGFAEEKTPSNLLTDALAVKSCSAAASRRQLERWRCPAPTLRYERHPLYRARAAGTGHLYAAGAACSGDHAHRAWSRVS